VTTRRHRPRPPRPDLLRRPSEAFGWLDAHLLHDGWLARLGPEATAVLVLLALAADRHGASFYARHTMARSLGTTLAAIDAALQRLRHLGLLDHRPWTRGCSDGVWQLLPAPRREQGPPRATTTPIEGPVPITAILAQLGFAPHRQNQAESDRR
jgi:hypothetical protein